VARALGAGLLLGLVAGIYLTLRVQGTEPAPEPEPEPAGEPAGTAAREQVLERPAGRRGLPPLEDSLPRQRGEPADPDRPSISIGPEGRPLLRAHGPAEPLQQRQQPQPRQPPRRRQQPVQREQRQPVQRGQVSITMFAARWCSACNAARRWLRRQNIPYIERDLDRDRGARRALRAINPRGSIPTFLINGRVLIGFSPRRITRAIQSASGG
jgi:glutaredoxin